jgi:hypothetical protein
MLERDVNNMRNYYGLYAPELLKTPAPMVLVLDTTPSWITVKAIYAMSDYGFQYVAADRFYNVALEHLKKKGITLANDRLRVEGDLKPHVDPFSQTSVHG